MRNHNHIAWGRPEPHTWTNRQIAVPGRIRSVAWSPKLALFAAIGYSQGYSTVGSYASIRTSEDGKTWTTRVDDVNIDGHWQVIWAPWLNGGSFVVSTTSSPGSGLLVSTDGETWIFHDTTDAVPYGIGGVGGLLGATDSALIVHDWVAGGGYITTDLVTWAAIDTKNITFLSPAGAPNFAWNGSLMVAVGIDNSTGAGKCITSPDGVTWTERAIPDRYWASVCWNEKLALWAACACAGAAGASSTTLIATSPDATTWTARTTGTHPFRAIAAAGVDADYPYFCAVAGAEAGRGGPAAIYSADGTTWSAGSFSITDEYTTGLAWSTPLEMFVALGYNDGGDFDGSIATSTKGD